MIVTLLTVVTVVMLLIVVTLLKVAMLLTVAVAVTTNDSSDNIMHVKYASILYNRRCLTE